jgi:hypothetical protein
LEVAVVAELEMLVQTLVELMVDLAVVLADGFKLLEWF